MASGMSIFYADQVLNDLLKGVEFTVPSTLYCAAFTQDANTITSLRNNQLTYEVVGNGYARVEVRGTSGIEFSSPSSGQSVNSADITFPAATGGWGTVQT